MNSFWPIIETMPVSRDYEARAEALITTLNGLSHENYVAFLTEFRSHYDSLSTNPDLANAIYLYNEGYLSGDTKHDFCYWLISLGHDNLQEVIVSPDKIIDFSKLFGEPNFEELGGAVWERANRENISLDSPFKRLQDDWLYEDNKQQELFPKLYAYCYS